MLSTTWPTPKDLERKKKTIEMQSNTTNFDKRLFTITWHMITTKYYPSNITKSGTHVPPTVRRYKHTKNSE